MGLECRCGRAVNFKVAQLRHISNDCRTVALCSNKLLQKQEKITRLMHAMVLPFPDEEWNEHCPRRGPLSAACTSRSKERFSFVFNKAFIFIH